MLNYKSSITKDYKLPDLTQPIIGISFSHAAIIAMAQAMHFSYVCIFEDDAYPCDDVYEKLQTYLNCIPNNAMMLKFGVLNVISKSQVKCINSMYYANLQTWGSHAYIVFKNYYNQYLKTFSYDIICDHLPFNANEMNLCCKEQLFIQYNQTDDCINGKNTSLKFGDII